MMDEGVALGMLDAIGAVITNSHVVYTSGRHGSAYVNKDVVYPHSYITSRLCRTIAEEFESDDVDVVVAPAVGGVILSQWVAHHLCALSNSDVDGIYAERSEWVLRKPSSGICFTVSVGAETYSLAAGQELVIKEDAFVIKRGYEKLVPGRRVLVVEDVLTTGGTVKKVIRAVRELGGEVVGLGALCNRGGLTAESIGVPKLFALTNVTLDSWEGEACPLCAQNVPINTDVGKGRDFLASQKKK